MIKNLDTEIACAEKLLASGKSVDDMLVVMRTMGCSQIDCLKIVMRAVGLSLRESKVIVDRSAAWSDKFDANEFIRDEILETIEEIDSKER